MLVLVLLVSHHLPSSFVVRRSKGDRQRRSFAPKKHGAHEQTNPTLLHNTSSSRGQGVRGAGKRCPSSGAWKEEKVFFFVLVRASIFNGAWG